MKEEKKTHIGSYGVIIKDDKIALIKKARGGYKGKLDLPGGGIEHDETPHQTLQRELMEEAGVEVLKQELLDTTSVTFKWQTPVNTIENLHHIGILYTVTPKEYKLKEIPDGLDSNGCNWYKIKDLKKEDLSPFTSYAIEKLGYHLD